MDLATNVPPRPEEEMAHAEDYRLYQDPEQPTNFDLTTPDGQLLHLSYHHGHVDGFRHPSISPEIATELQREIRQILH